MGKEAGCRHFGVKSVLLKKTSIKKNINNKMPKNERESRKKTNFAAGCKY
ncbi:MAG: hypothetical protein IJ925_00180 [Muribaculaceae bacterium]|nr:hypothetical protein [Muribaculaceae bacterium]